MQDRGFRVVTISSSSRHASARQPKSRQRQMTYWSRVWGEIANEPKLSAMPLANSAIRTQVRFLPYFRSTNREPHGNDIQCMPADRAFLEASRRSGLRGKKGGHRTLLPGAVPGRVTPKLFPRSVQQAVDFVIRGRRSNSASQRPNANPGGSADFVQELIGETPTVLWFCLASH